MPPLPPRRVPTISVVVRVVAPDGLLEEALASVEAQTLCDHEVVLVDGTEGLLAPVVERWRARLGALHHVALPRRCCTRPAALNAGAGSAAAPLVAILDHDNLYDPDHLERLCRGLEAAEADLVYTGVRHETFTPARDRVSSREVSIGFAFDRLLLGNFVYTSGTAFRRELWQRVGGYDERFLVFEDWEFLIRATQVGRVAHLPGASATSRKFSGLDGIANFDRELGDVRRCLVGVYWRHRDLYRGSLRAELKVAAADHCRRRVRPRSGLLAREVAGWRLELLRDLFCWWVHSVTFSMRRRRSRPWDNA